MSEQSLQEQIDRLSEHQTELAGVQLTMQLELDELKAKPLDKDGSMIMFKLQGMCIEISKLSVTLLSLQLKMLRMGVEARNRQIIMGLDEHEEPLQYQTPDESVNPELDDLAPTA